LATNKSNIIRAYEDAKDNYAGLCEVYDKSFHRLALIYYSKEDGCDLVIREHHDAMGECVKGYPKCLRTVCGDLMVLEPLPGFCAALSKIWKPYED